MKTSKLQVLTRILMALVIASNIITIFFLINYQSNLPSQIKSIVDTSIQSIAPIDNSKKISEEVDAKINSIDINSAIDKAVKSKVDSLNLKNGLNGKDSVSAQTTVLKETTTSIKGNTGATGPAGERGPEGASQERVLIDCDIANNYWIIQYNELDGYQMLGGTPKKCVPN